MITNLENLEQDFLTEEVQKIVLEILEKSQELSSFEWYSFIFSCIDLTSLNATDSAAQGNKIALKVSEFKQNFPQLPTVAAICVYPTLLGPIKKNLQTSEVKLASVSGGFPSSQTFLDVKVLETMMAIDNGANEVDIVLNLGDFLNEDYESVKREIRTLKAAIGDTHLKVILETGALKSYSKIWKASMISMEAGADFIKTSTGKFDPAATPEAAWIMCRAIKLFYEKTQIKVGFKAAGGITETNDALVYLAIVKEVLGDEWLTKDLFRIGASRLANNLLTSIMREKVSYF
jgi:deoxyribose-phosphate aldolase